MIATDLPLDHRFRLQALKELERRNTPPQEAYGDFAGIAAGICERPIALIKLNGESKFWHHSQAGPEVTLLEPEYTFILNAILKQEEPFEVVDTSKNDRYRDNPLVLGEAHVASFCGVPLLSSDGISLGILCVFDHQPGALSPRQLESLHALAKQLSELIMLRKNILELNATQSVIQKAYQDLDQYAYRVAHDLKGPLNNLNYISSFLNEEYKGTLNQDGIMYLGMMSELSHRLSNLVTGILDTSKMISMDYTETSSFSFKELLSEVLFLIGTDSSVSIIVPEEDCVLQSNRYGLHIILQNLISNAIKYNDHENPVIKIGFAAEEDCYRISVKDNGPGIEPEFQDVIFEHFNTLGKNDRYGQKGTGLGLSMVKGLMAKMNGEIHLKSQPGAGSEFIATLKNWPEKTPE